MAKVTTLDHLHDKLFADDLSDLTTIEQKMIKRYNAAFTIWLDKPTKPEIEIVKYLIKEHGISRSLAYRDIKNIKYLLGNVTNAQKEWQRYKLIFMVDEAYEMARKKGDVQAMAMIIDKFGKYTQLDKEDARDMPWEEIIPQLFEPTDDPTVLGLKQVPNLQEKINKLKKKYLDMIDIEDVTYERGGTGGD